MESLQEFKLREHQFKTLPNLIFSFWLLVWFFSIVLFYLSKGGVLVMPTIVVGITEILFANKLAGLFFTILTKFILIILKW